MQNNLKQETPTKFVWWSYQGQRQISQQWLNQEIEKQEKFNCNSIQIKK